MSVSVQVIAIDGPAASGKSSVARRVATEVLHKPLGEGYLDTGAMYRSVTWAALANGTDLNDADKLAELTANLSAAITYPASTANTASGEPIQKVLINGQDATEQIRTSDVDQAASVVAAHPRVREVLVRQQRDWIAKHQPAVVEGRDIGSVVVPEAVLKIFLTANEQERARRRQGQRADGTSGSPEVSSNEADALAQRDNKDTSRAESPLLEAEGAVVLDTSNLTLDEVVAEIKRLYAAAKP